MNFIEQSAVRRRMELLLLAAGVLLAILLRYTLLFVRSGDYRAFLKPWWDFIVRKGNFAALQYDFADYNVPYLYLLAAGSVLFPGFSPLYVIKGISIVFDFALALFVSRCVLLKYSASGRRWAGAVSFTVTLLAPTVLVNSAMWGQCDAIYTTFLVASLYYLLAGHQAAAFTAFGVAFAFKLQAVFMAPLFLWLFVKKVVCWRYFLLIPLMYLVSILPAWLIGRPFTELLLIYPSQAFSSQKLNLNAPNFYIWISNADSDWLFLMGLALTGGTISALAVLVYKSRATITADLVVLLAMVSVLVTPYLLPKMRDRYFFPADVIAIVFAFYWPRYWYVPIVIGLVSLLVYVMYLVRGLEIVPTSWLPGILLALIFILGREFLRIFANKAA